MANRISLFLLLVVAIHLLVFRLNIDAKLMKLIFAFSCITLVSPPQKIMQLHQRLPSVWAHNDIFTPSTPCCSSSNAPPSLSSYSFTWHSTKAFSTVGTRFHVLHLLPHPLLSPPFSLCFTAAALFKGTARRRCFRMKLEVLPSWSLFKIQRN